VLLWHVSSSIHPAAAQHSPLTGVLLVLALLSRAAEASQVQVWHVLLMWYVLLMWHVLVCLQQGAEWVGVRCHP
jgi:hypothetical protein